MVTFPGEHDFCSKKLSKNVDDDAMEYGTHSSMAAKYPAAVPHSGATRAPESELKQSHHHNSASVTLLSLLSVGDSIKPSKSG